VSAEDLAKQAAERVREAVSEAEGRAKEIVAEAERRAEEIVAEAERTASEIREKAQAEPEPEPRREPEPEPTPTRLRKPPADEQGARLVAMKMALDGASREQIVAWLDDEIPEGTREQIATDVLERASR
jgi:hypothetical protein